MHHSWQRGSIARVAVAFPMSAGSQSNCSMIRATVRFASASLPQ
jgi:hypothetical protein